jgi:hypothetical protein
MMANGIVFENRSVESEKIILFCEKTLKMAMVG